VEAEEGVGVGEELEARVGGDAGHAEAVRSRSAGPGRGAPGWAGG